MLISKAPAEDNANKEDNNGFRNDKYSQNTAPKKHWQRLLQRNQGYGQPTLRQL